MDNFMDNRWILRGIALLVTLLLFMSVNLVPQSSSSGLGDIPFVNNKELLKDVPVTPIYDQQNLIVTGIPKKVSVQLDGPNSIVKTAEMKRDFEVYLDLTSYALGTYEVPLKVRNLSDKVKATIKPRTVKVTIKEKIEKAVSIKVTYKNEQEIKHGYKAEDAIVKPNVIKIVGSAEEVSQVAYASVDIDVADANQTFSQVLPVKLYNKKGIQLSLSSVPKNVEVTVPIVSESAYFPIEIIQTGTLQDGLKLNSLVNKVDEVKVYASEDWLDKFGGAIQVPVDISEFDKSGTYEITVPTPDGAFKVDPSTIEVDVNFSEEKEQKFTNIPIELVGEEDNFSYKILKPSIGKVVVSARGFEEDLKAIDPKDISITAKVNGLEAGTHDVTLNISAPKGVIYRLDYDTVTIEITDKKAAQTEEKSEEVGQSSN
jgi:YbbR domain-containing protein